MVKSVIGKRTAIAAFIAAVALLFVAAVGCSNVFAKEKFNVVFFSDGGSAVSSQTVEDGDKATRPADPTKTGYAFVGWYSDLELTEEWKFDTDTVSEETVLYAKWRALDGTVLPDDDRSKNCVIMFFENGGTPVHAQRVAMGDKVTLPATPAKAGMIFDGWYKDKDFNAIWLFDTDTVTQKSTILYAKWIPDPSGGNDGNTGNDPSGGNTGNDPSGGNGGGNTDNGGGNTGVSSDTVTVTFNVGLNARKLGLSNPPAVKLNKGGTVSQPTVALSGYTLKGWYAEDGLTAWNFSTGKVDTNTTLYARWSSSSGKVDYTPELREDNTLYIHYLRNGADDYDGWSLWIWEDGRNGKKYVTDIRDRSGLVFAIPLDLYGTSGKVNFKPAIIDESGTWITEDGSDAYVLVGNALKVGNSYHWFVREGETGNGTAYLSAGGSMGDNAETEDKRATVNDVDRSKAASLPIAETVKGWDETGIGYQIFVASFCDSDGDGVGDIRGIINKLDYLQGLNVDVLWLTPIQSSNSYHGYDCYDYYAIDSKFGTNADYRELVYKAHRKGMKIIMDLVVNHTSPNNEWFIKSKQGVIETVTYQDGTTAKVKYRDFYRWSDKSGSRKYSSGDGWYFYSSFGSNMPELNYDCQAVRDAMSDVAAYWMNFGLDGFRMDAIKHLFMWDESENLTGDKEGGANDKPYNYNLTKNVEFFKEFNHKLKSKYPQCFLLGEQLSGNVNDVSPFYNGMDSLFDFNTYYDMPSKINSGSAATAASALNANAEKYAEHRGDRPINSMISSNHDIPRLSSKLDTKKSKLYFAITMTMPGLSWIYYGDEIGLAGAGGNDKNYRQSMKWTSDWTNGCKNEISGTDLNLTTVSVAEQERDDGSLLSYVKALGALRNSHPALINGSATCSVDNGMLKIVVTGKTETLTVYHNFTNESKSVSGNIVFGGNTVAAYGTAVVK